MKSQTNEDKKLFFVIYDSPFDNSKAPFYITTPKTENMAIHEISIMKKIAPPSRGLSIVPLLMPKDKFLTCMSAIAGHIIEDGENLTVCFTEKQKNALLEKNHADGPRLLSHYAIKSIANNISFFKSDKLDALPLEVQDQIKHEVAKNSPK